LDCLNENLAEQNASLRRQLQSARQHDVMHFKKHSPLYRHTSSRRFKSSEQTSGESGYLQIAIDCNGEIEKIHVELDSGRPFVGDHNQFIELVSSAGFVDGRCTRDMITDLPHSWPNDNIIVYVLEWIRQEVKIVRDSKSEIKI